MEVALLGIDGLLHSLAWRESLAGEAPKMKHAAFGGLPHGHNCKRIVARVFRSHRAGVGGLASALHVEDGLLGNDHVVVIGCVLQQSLVGIWKTRDGLDRYNLCRILSQCILVQINEFG